MTRVSVSEAKTRFTELLRLVESGEEVVVIDETYRNDGNNVNIDLEMANLAETNIRYNTMASLAKGKFEPGFSAARSQDFLYGDDGLPG